MGKGLVREREGGIGGVSEVSEVRDHTGRDGTGSWTIVLKM